MDSDLMKRLQEPFPEDCVEWRLAQAGKNQKGFWAKCLAYIQARAVMDRLDHVIGSENWKVKYEMVHGGVLCTLSLRIGGEWIDKVDGADATDIEPFKGAISGALKRAAVLWGLGRYLYDLEEAWVEIVQHGTKGARYGQTKEKETFYWIPPRLPEWALPPKAPGADRNAVNRTDIVPNAQAVSNTDNHGKVSVTISKVDAEKIMISANGNAWDSAQVLDLARKKYQIDRLGKLPVSRLEEFIETVSKRRPEMVFAEINMQQNSNGANV